MRSPWETLGPAHAFKEAFTRQVAFGTLSAVWLPEGVEPVADLVLAQLHSSECERAVAHRARRQIEWVGGRLAVRQALAAAGLPAGPLLSGTEGEPIGTDGASISVSHKPDLALALVAPLERGTVGVDLESARRPRPAIASHVLNEREKAWWATLPSNEQWPALISIFAVKEATYKAIYPRVRRYVAFAEADVQLTPAIRVELTLAKGELAPRVEAELEVAGDRVLAMARCPR